MKISAFCAIAVSVFVCLPAHSESLPEISAFAKDVCDEISAEGNITRRQIEAKIEGKIGGIAKLIGASVGADGKLKIEDTNYKGLPYENVADQMKDARDCRKQLATMLIEERNRIAREKSAQSKVTYKTCRHPDFGQVGWQREETIDQSSGWRDGGSNPTNWCNEMIVGFVRGHSIGPDHTSQILNSSEEARWTGIRHREYNYHCTAKISWLPLYAERTDPRCGIIGSP